MSTFKLKSGKRIKPNRAFTDDSGLSHPANWHVCYKAEDKERYGIEEFPEPPRPPRPEPTVEELAKRRLSELDNKLRRETEDIIDVLIAKGVATIEDFPAIISDTYNEKKAERAKLPEPEPEPVVEEPTEEPAPEEEINPVEATTGAAL